MQLRITALYSDVIYEKHRCKGTAFIWIVQDLGVSLTIIDTIENFSGERFCGAEES